MAKRAILVLEDGSIHEGHAFGAVTSAFGEVVFDTGMTGYQEMITDPSFAGQILVPTYPMIGNYGVSECHSESGRIQIRGLAVREHCRRPSHRNSTGTLHDFLLAHGVPGISGLDTRSLTRHVRAAGVMMAIVTSEITAEEALAGLARLPGYDFTDFVRQVSTERAYTWPSDRPCAVAPTDNPRPAGPLKEDSDTSSPHIVVIDYGVKYSILRIFSRLGCRVTVVPYASSAEDVLALNPQGIVLSPGPGNPHLLDDLTHTVRKLIGRKPLMGICLGHQLIGQAMGASTFKLKSGHRGGNQPVRDLITGRVYITAQSHGYALDADTISGGLEVSHINLNDGTVEGLRHRDCTLLSVQYHAEASPGPLDNVYLFEQFVDMVRQHGKR